MSRGHSDSPRHGSLNDVVGGMKLVCWCQHIPSLSAGSGEERGLQEIREFSHISWLVNAWWWIKY